MSSQYPIFKLYVLTVSQYLHSPCSECTTPLQHNSRQSPCPVSSLSPLSISSQFTISLVHVQSIHYLSCPCLASSPSLVCVQSIHYLSCPCPVSSPSHLSMSSQYTISPAHVQSVRDLSCPCCQYIISPVHYPVSTSLLLPMLQYY